MNQIEMVAPAPSTDSREIQHAARAIEVSGAMAMEIIDDPALLDDIPNGCTLILLPDGEPEFAEYRISLGLEAVRRGENVYFKHVPAGFGKHETNGE